MSVIVVGSVGSRGVLRLHEEERITQISRRTVVKGMAAAGALAVLPAIAACGDDEPSSGGSSSSGETSKGGGTGARTRAGAADAPQRSLKTAPLKLTA
jgi:hypothetical protein